MTLAGFDPAPNSIQPPLVDAANSNATDLRAGNKMAGLEQRYMLSNRGLRNAQRIGEI
jgi:hypothetical protein